LMKIIIHNHHQIISKSRIKKQFGLGPIINKSFRKLCVSSFLLLILLKGKLV
jgi:hypothetical protein